MSILPTIVPGLLLVYLIIGARRHLAVVCALPLVLYFGRSAFLDTYSWSYQVGPITIIASDVIFAGLVLVWGFVRQKRPRATHLSLGLSSVPMALVLVLVLVEVAQTWLDGYKLVRVVQTARYYAYMPASYFIWIDLWRRFTQDEARDFVRSVSMVTVPLLGLYALSALNMPVYPYAKYQVIDLGTGTVARDFLTFAPLAPVALAYYLAAGRRNLGWLLAVGIISTSIMLTFTRSIILPAILSVIVSSLLVGGSRKRSLSLAGAGILAIVVSFELLSTVSPDAVDVLASRFADLRVSGMAGSSLGVRMNMVTGIGDAIGGTNPVLGGGIVPYDSADPTGTIYRPDWILGDIMWSSVLLYFGLAGLTVFGLVTVAALLHSLRLALREAGAGSGMGLFLLLVFVQMSAVTFTGEGFLRGGAVAGLWFALVTVERQRLWAASPITVAGLPALRGISSSWLLLTDEHWLLRRMVLALLTAATAVYIGYRIAM